MAFKLIDIERKEILIRKEPIDIPVFLGTKLRYDTKGAFDARIGFVFGEISNRYRILVGPVICLS